MGEVEQLIESLINRVDLSEDEAEASLQYLLNDANEASISAFLVLLRAKGETYEEVSPSFELLSEFVLVIVTKNKSDSSDIANH